MFRLHVKKSMVFLIYIDFAAKCFKFNTTIVSKQIILTKFIWLNHCTELKQSPSLELIIYSSSYKVLLTHNTSLGYIEIFFLLKHTWNSSVLCYLPHNCPPQVEKNIHSVYTQGQVGDTAGSAAVCLRENPCCSVCFPCAQPLHTFSPLSSRGKSTERHHFKAHTATYSFPCQQSHLTHSLLIAQISFSTILLDLSRVV